MVICGNEGVVEIEYNCGVNTPWRVENAMCEKKVLCAKRKCYVRKENAMCAMKELWCEMKMLCAKWDWWAGCQGNSLKFI